MKLFNLIPDNFTIAKVLTQKEANEVFKEMENPCWKGYEMVGTKKKDGREVPNCVPVNEETSDDDNEGGHCYTCTNHRHRLIEHRLSQIEFYTVGAWLVVPKLKEQIETLELIINVSAYMLLIVVLIHYLKLTPVA